MVPPPEVIDQIGVYQVLAPKFRRRDVFGADNFWCRDVLASSIFGTGIIGLRYFCAMTSTENVMIIIWG